MSRLLVLPSVSLGLFIAAAAAPATADQPLAQTPPTTATKIGASLHGARWDFPCKEPMPENPTPGSNCHSAVESADPKKKIDQFTLERKFDGEPGKRYRVTLRFRGVVEPMMYKNGEMDGDYFYRGGEPNNSGYNIYKLSIASPPAHFFLNRQDKVAHKIFAIDYEKTIEIDGGATVTLHGNGQNGKLISNYSKLVVPDVPPAPQPFNGQFVQMDVVKVEPAP